MYQWKKASTQPAKLADRVIAPGDGAAPSLGLQAKNQLSLRSWRQMPGQQGSLSLSQIRFMHVPSVAHFAGSERARLLIPRLSAAPSPGAITLSASFAGSLKAFNQIEAGRKKKTSSKNKKLIVRFADSN